MAARAQDSRPPNMGQYFKLVNMDREETVSLPGTMKPIERVTNAKAMALIGYLIFQGPQDGTSFIRMNADPDSLTDEQFEEYDIGIADDEEKRRHQAARSYEASRPISEANDFAGRWAGDRIVLVGDYDDSGLYGADLHDITGGLIAEFKEFVGESWWEGEQESVMRPDMVFQA